MKKIATHNSSTGERGCGLLSWLVTPFSRCQNKTLTEQYDVGVRYFDIRIRKTKRGWVSAHGLWESEKTIHELLQELNDHAKEECFISLCYEGTGCYEDINFIDDLEIKYNKITVTYYAIKKPYWRVVMLNKYIECEQAYKRLDFSTLHTLLPLPRLWKRFFFRDVEFNEKTFKMVDFV